MNLFCAIGSLFAIAILTACSARNAESCQQSGSLPMLFEMEIHPKYSLSFNAVSCFDTMHDCENTATAMRDELHGKYFTCINCDKGGCFVNEDYR